MEDLKRVWKEIRDNHPGKPFGNCWECLGFYCGDGVWADPEYVGFAEEAALAMNLSYD